MTLVLETERLLLRELLLNDVEPLAAILANPRVTEHVGGPRAPAAVRAWIQEQQLSYRGHRRGYWAVVHRDSATLVGHAGLYGAPPALGCVLDEPFWGHGLGTEILTAVRDYAFEELDAESLTATVERNNEAGKKLAAAIGMRVADDGAGLAYVVDRKTS